jgi:tRNA A37 threonylcarbamoyladenosine biosynthesis protein TsaE
MNPHYQKFELSADQAAAFSKLQVFLNSEEQVFVLTGYAGTGKTTLLKELCRYLFQQRRNFKLSAPTGRAAMILGDKTEQEAMTIHRHLYNFHEIEEVKQGTSFKYYFRLNSDNQESEKTIYIVDEASMLSNTYQEDEFFIFGSGYLLQDLLTYVFERKSENKLILIGDNAQLPPVDMNFSPALSTSYLTDIPHFNFLIEEACLRQVVRQKENSGVLRSAQRLRESLENKQFQTFSLEQSQHDVHLLEQQQWLPTYLQRVKEADEGVIITHANHRALSYNLEIRKHRFGDANIQLQTGEWLLIVKNNYRQAIELYNGMLAKVLEIGSILRSEDIVFKGKQNQKHRRKLVFRSIRIEVTCYGQQHELTVPLLENMLWEPSGRIDPLDQQALYVDFKMRMQAQKISPGSDSFKNNLKQDPWFNALQAKFGYAMTCHKAQGGEWAHVFVDFSTNFALLSQAYFRWAYTAITRSNDQLYCINLRELGHLDQFVIQETEQLSRALPDMYYRPTAPNNNNFFVEYRLQCLRSLAEENDLELTYSHSAYMLDLTFSRASVTLRSKLYYSNQGFTKSQTDSNSALTEEVNAILLASILPLSVPFTARSPAQQQLHDHMLNLLQELDLPLTNIVQREWSDVYFFKTDADCTCLEFFFNSQYVFTKAIPRSTHGKTDVQLQAMIAHLQRPS